MRSDGYLMHRTQPAVLQAAHIMSTLLQLRLQGLAHALLAAQQLHLLL